MTELGMLLRKARLEKGISLDDLQESTKIRKRYLEAIEDGNLKLLPGNFYIRAFIKSYAEAVGLEPNQILSMYKNVLPSTTLEPLSEPLRRNRTDSKIKIKWGQWASGIILWSFLILVIVLIYIFVNNNYEGNKQTGGDLNSLISKLTDKKNTESPYPSNSAVATPGSSPTPVVITPTPTPIAPEIKLVISRNGIDYYATASSTMTMEITASGGSCWVGLEKLNSDGTRGQTVDQATLTDGQSRSWEYSEPIFLTLGNAKNVEVKVNGMLIPDGDVSNVKRFQFEVGKSL